MGGCSKNNVKRKTINRFQQEIPGIADSIEENDCICYLYILILNAIQVAQLHNVDDDGITLKVILFQV